MAIKQLDKAAAQIVDGTCGDPFSYLGMHKAGRALVVRAFLPEASAVAVVDAATGAVAAELPRLDPAGLFAGPIAGRTEAFAYRLRLTTAEGEREIEDPYRFPPLLGEMDVYLIAEGRHLRLDEKLGSRLMTLEGVDGVAFAVWAPNAKRVSVVGNFNAWDGRRHPMRFRAECGVWELFIPKLREGELYKYEILGKDGRLQALKQDPFAFFCEQSPGTAAIVYDLSRYGWADGEWMQKRGETVARNAPFSIYEVHLGSWRRGDEHGRRYLTYAELADELIPYVYRPRLQPHRAAADLGASLRRLLGLPAARPVRSHQPVRPPRRVPQLRRPLPSGRPRRHPRLGARPLPHRRPGARLLRRHPPLRARRSPPRHAPGLGNDDLQLRPLRGGRLPAQQRAVLDGGVPHRRPARGCGRLHALPRLQPQGGRVDPERVRRQREPGSDRLPQADERDPLREVSERHHHRRGVDLVADGVPARLPRRPRLRLQVEHGLDARHARLHQPRSHLPQVPARPADLRADLRLQRELRPAAVP